MVIYLLSAFKGPTDIKQQSREEWFTRTREEYEIAQGQNLKPENFPQ